MTESRPPSSTAPTKTVLFVCTGNFYRSRFAEAVFNHLAEAAGSEWRAVSRGLAIHLVLHPAEGDLAPQTRDALETRGIPRHRTAPGRVQLQSSDLEDADLVVALCEREHRPLMADLFPEWPDRVVYWTVEDVALTHPDGALPEIERRVEALLAELRER